MNKSTALLPILMAGLLATAGAYAQSAPASASTDGPPKAGEASNQTMGAPNAKTTNSPFSEAPSPGASVTTVTTVPAAPVVAATTVSTTTIMGAAPARSPEEEVITRRARFEAMRRAMLNNSHYSIVNGDIVVQ